jgi:hypothetical protein
MTMFRRVSLVLWALSSLVVLAPLTLAAGDDQTCSIVDVEERDPALKEFTYDVGDGPKKMWAYVEPDVTSFYRLQDKPPASTKVVPKFNGLAGKFINMSPKSTRLYWEPHAGGVPALMRHHGPWSSGGTATFPGHRFFFTPEEDPNTRLIEFVIKEYPESIYVYDPITVPGNDKETKKNLKQLSRADKAKYENWVKTLSFSDQYLNFTGRTYLTNYLREPPAHYMWRADFFGQEHWVTSKESHFVTVPPQKLLEPIKTYGKGRILTEDQPRLLSEYRSKDPVLNMTLKAISCAPRAFEIPNFLSPAEVQHILELAGAIELKESTTGDVGSDTTGKKVDLEEEKKRKTRTSLNSWVEREKSPVIDAIYRRSADLLRIDEAKMRYRGDGEFPNLGTPKSIAESLQLVHYDPTQEVGDIL